MKTRTTATALAACIAMSMCGAAYGNPDETALDVSSVTKVIVTGEASTIRLTAAGDAPYKANLRSIRKGWFAGWQSGWFSGACEPAGAMRIENATLFIDVPSSSFFDFSECTVELRANVPAGVIVSIDQAALMASLSGDFADVKVRGKAADVSLDGHADSIDVEGEAIRTRFDFSGTDEKDETVRIDAKALDADLTFAGGTPVSYKIDATASFVDSKLVNTPGAKSSVSIKAEFLRASIR